MNEQHTGVPITAADVDAAIGDLSDRSTASVRRLRRRFSRDLRCVSPREVVALAFGLLKYASFLHRFVAYELVAAHGGALASLRERDLQLLGRDLDSWWAVDTFALYLAGPVWREHAIPDSVVHQWVRSRDRWRRRTAVVSTVALNCRARGGTGDTRRTLDVCAMLVDDRDDMVVKALSWALRELSKTDAAAVQSFLAVHRPALAARVLREVGNKLATGRKNPRVGA